MLRAQTHPKINPLAGPSAQSSQAPVGVILRYTKAILKNRVQKNMGIEMETGITMGNITLNFNYKPKP